MAARVRLLSSLIFNSSYSAVGKSPSSSCSRSRRCRSPLTASVLALLLLAFMIYVRCFFMPSDSVVLCPWYLSDVIFVFFRCPFRSVARPALSLFACSALVP